MLGIYQLGGPATQRTHHCKMVRRRCTTLLSSGAAFSGYGNEDHDYNITFNPDYINVAPESAHSGVPAVTGYGFLYPGDLVSVGSSYYNGVISYVTANVIHLQDTVWQYGNRPRPSQGNTISQQVIANPNQCAVNPDGSLIMHCPFHGILVGDKVTLRWDFYYNYPAASDGHYGTNMTNYVGMWTNMLVVTVNGSSLTLTTTPDTVKSGSPDNWNDGNTWPYRYTGSLTIPTSLQFPAWLEVNPQSGVILTTCPLSESGYPGIFGLGASGTDPQVVIQLPPAKVQVGQEITLYWTVSNYVRMRQSLVCWLVDGNNNSVVHLATFGSWGDKLPAVGTDVLMFVGPSSPMSVEYYQTGMAVGTSFNRVEHRAVVLNWSDPNGSRVVDAYGWLTDSVWGILTG